MDGFMMLDEYDASRWSINDLPDEDILMDAEHLVASKAVTAGTQTAFQSIYGAREMEGFMMLDELDSRWGISDLPDEDLLIESDQVGNVKSTASSSQTVSGSRKIRPVKHPGLKLQTPIAYQRDTDLNVIPIQKEGRAVCRNCGAIGVKHAFYTRERRYCSLACARAAAGDPMNAEVIKHSSPQHSPNQCSDNSQQSDTWPDFTCHLGMAGRSDQSDLPPLVYNIPSDDSPFSRERRSGSEMSNSYNWSEQLNDPNFFAAPTSSFKHAPMAECWDDYVSPGMKVEVENTDECDFRAEFPNCFWIATVIKIAGYKALLRYEGSADDNRKDFWVNLCCSSVQPVGWCASRGRPLIPPKRIKEKYTDFKDLLVKSLSGARTLPRNYYNKVLESIKSRFRCDLRLEAIDKDSVSQVKVASIEKIIGKRLQLRYFDAKNNSSSGVFWCHEDSPLIHPVGWAKRVGQTLEASFEYHDRIMKGLREKDDATADLFPICDLSMPPNCMFQEGMKLEAIDPLNLADICIATVVQVLNEGYLMICVDFWNDDKNSTRQDWFCYHMSSPCIFPAGFCQANDIPLTPPKGYNRSTFDWNRYLQETGCKAAPVDLFQREIPNHSFKAGMKLEAADLMNPKLVCVATVKRVVGRLLKIHFDGWEDEFDQWVDCNSCDIYPVGWCEFVSHKLEPPNTQKTVLYGKTVARTTSKRRRGKNSPAIPQEYHIDNSYEAEEIFKQKVQMMIEDDVESSMDDSRFIDHDNSEIFATSSHSALTEIPVHSNVTNFIQNAAAPVVSAKIANLPRNSTIEQPSGEKVIPKLTNIKSRSSVVGKGVCPEIWDLHDVAEFLKVNDCSAYCDAFMSKEIDGSKLLNLSKEEVHDLTGMKVGPSLKIQNLIHQLKLKTSSNSPRSSKTAALSYK